MVSRPVKKEQPSQIPIFVDPKTGKLAPYGHRLLFAFFNALGGFNDDIADLLALGTAGAVDANSARARAEMMGRRLDDARLEARAALGEQLVARVGALEQQLGLSTATFASLAGRFDQRGMRVTTYTASDTWYRSDGVVTLEVFVVGGGGGGGGGTAGSSGGGGGGGANYSYGAIEAAELPASVAITVGAAGVGGNTANNGTAGGDSSFGGFLAAKGGTGGLANGTAGAANTLPGGLFLGGPGGAGNSGGGSGSEAPNDYEGCPGGGGGAYSSGGDTGGAGGAGAWRTTSATGGGGAGGFATGSGGSSNPISATFIGPGFGGGGGGSNNTTSGAGGDGVNGAGGGGGGARAGGAGRGGDGGAGKVWVIEYY